MKALEVNKKCLRAVVLRRPTVLDAMARVVAAEIAHVQFADDRRGVSASVSAANELRMATRIADAGWSHFATGWRTWVKVGSTVRAECRRKIIRDKLFGGGAGAFFAAAAGASFDAAVDDSSSADPASRRKRKGELLDLENAQVLGVARPLRALIASERAAIAARSTRRVLARAGEVFCQQGFPGATAYVVLSGSLESLVKKPGAQNDVDGGVLLRAGKLKPGACFGETCLLLGARRAATVRATRDSWLLEVGKKGIEWALTARPCLVDDLATCAAKASARERVIGDEGAGDDSDDDDLGLIDDDGRTSSEEHRTIVNRVLDWVFKGEIRGLEAGSEDTEDAVMGTEGDSATGLRPTRSRLAFGEATKKVMGVLQSVDVFNALDRTQMLVMLREGADLETHPPGSRVCVQGDDTRDVMFVVMEGELEVQESTLADPRASAASGKTETKAIRTLERGDVFGESRLFTGAPCGCDVTATYRGATLITLSPNAIGPILRNVESFVPTVASTLASRRDADQNSRVELDSAPDATMDRAGRLDASIRLRHGLPFPGEDVPRTIKSVNDTFQSNGKFPAVMDDELSRALRARHPFFRRFTAAELASVAALGVVRTIGTGKHICAQGEDGTTVFIVVSGVAMVFIEERRRDDGAVKRKVGELVPGQTSAEECVLSDGETRRARTIIASPPGVRVIELGRDSFGAAFARRPALVDQAGEYLASLEPL
jgi:CRP-like cAMP-binding protein